MSSFQNVAISLPLKEIRFPPGTRRAVVFIIHRATNRFLFAPLNMSCFWHVAIRLDDPANHRGVWEAMGVAEFDLKSDAMLQNDDEWTKVCGGPIFEHLVCWIVACRKMLSISSEEVLPPADMDSSDLFLKFYHVEHVGSGAFVKHRLTDVFKYVSSSSGAVHLHEQVTQCKNASIHLNFRPNRHTSPYGAKVLHPTKMEYFMMNGSWDVSLFNVKEGDSDLTNKDAKYWTNTYWTFFRDIEWEKALMFVKKMCVMYEWNDIDAKYHYGIVFVESCSDGRRVFNSSCDSITDASTTKPISYKVFCTHSRTHKTLPVRRDHPPLLINIESLDDRIAGFSYDVRSTRTGLQSWSSTTSNTSLCWTYEIGGVGIELNHKLRQRVLGCVPICYEQSYGGGVLAWCADDENDVLFQIQTQGLQAMLCGMLESRVDKLNTDHLHKLCVVVCGGEKFYMDAFCNLLRSESAHGNKVRKFIDDKVYVEKWNSKVPIVTELDTDKGKESGSLCWSIEYYWWMDNKTDGGNRSNRDRIQYRNNNRRKFCDIWKMWNHDNPEKKYFHVEVYDLLPFSDDHERGMVKDKQKNNLVD